MLSFDGTERNGDVPIIVESVRNWEKFKCCTNDCGTERNGKRGNNDSLEKLQCSSGVPTGVLRSVGTGCCTNDSGTERSGTGNGEIMTS